MIELLGKVPAFEQLTKKDLKHIAEVAVPRRFDANSTVFRAGDRSDTCYVVGSGKARAIREHSDGRTIALATFGPGDIFGELAMFDDEARSATVETITEVEAVAILGGDMHRVIRTYPEIAAKLVAALGSRLREANDRLARQSFQNVQGRVATALAGLADEVAEADGRRSGEILVKTTQADLAKLAGSSRESASRFIAVLERAGVLSQGRGRITVHDLPALKRYVY